MRCSDSIVMMAVFAIFVLGRGILYMSTCSLWTKSSKGAFVLIFVFILSTDGGGWTVGTIPLASCKELAALDEYLELRGVKRPRDLPCKTR